MTDTMSAEMPGDGWTLNGLAYCQVIIARDDLERVALNIRGNNRKDAIERISAVIRELEAARRHLL
jgi:hypothetical protein